MRYVRIEPGATSRSLRLAIYKDDGTANASLLFNSTGLIVRYGRDNGALVQVTLVALASATAAYASGGFVHIANGVYRLDVPDAALAAGANTVVIMCDEASGIRGEPLVVDSDVATGTRSAYAGGDTPGTTTLVGLLTAARAANLDRLDVAVSSRAQPGDQMTLTAGVSSALATAIQAGIIDENDGQQVLQAIVSKINATDVNLAGLSTATIAAAVWQYLFGNATAASVLTDARDRATSAKTSADATTDATTTLATAVASLATEVGAIPVGGLTEAQAALLEVLDKLTFGVGDVGTLQVDVIKTLGAPVEIDDGTGEPSTPVPVVASVVISDEDKAAIAGLVLVGLIGRDVKLVSRILTDGTLELYSGDAYTDDEAIVIPVPSGQYIEQSVELRLLPTMAYDANRNTSPATIVAVGSVVMGSTAAMAVVPLTATQTASLAPARSGDGVTYYRYQVIATALNVTLADGKCAVRRRIAAA